MKELRDELRITEKILETREQVLNAIPECPNHGKGCTSHALEWIAEAKQAIEEVAHNQEPDPRVLGEWLGQAMNLETSIEILQGLRNYLPHPSAVSAAEWLSVDSDRVKLQQVIDFLVKELEHHKGLHIN